MKGAAGCSTLLLLAAFVVGAAADQQRVLVLLEDMTVKNTHSLLFNSLASPGNKLEFKSVTDSSIKLRDYDRWLYDKLVIFASGVNSLGGELDASTLATFVDEGGDVLLAVDSNISDTMRELVAEMGIEVEARGSEVTDHFHYDAALGPDHTVVAATDATTSKAVLDGPLKAPVLFKGIGLTVPRGSTLALKALTAPATAFSSGSGSAAGVELVLVALVQARNNARVAISGSIDMFSNKLFRASTMVGASAKTAANAEFATQVARWTFQQRGVLQATNLRHKLIAEGGVQQGVYRVNDRVLFELDVMLKDGDKLVPYKGEDMQVELVMLDPYVRQALIPNDKGTFSADIHVPDVYGVFKFVIDYRRPGYSWVQLEEQVPIRPYRHNEYERFLTCAFPYYVGAASMMAGFFVLGPLVLYTK